MASCGVLSLGDSTKKYIIQQGRRSKQQNHLHITCFAHGKNRFIRAQQVNERFG